MRMHRWLGAALIVLAAVAGGVTLGAGVAQAGEAAPGWNATPKYNDDGQLIYHECFNECLKGSKCCYRGPF